MQVIDFFLFYVTHVYFFTCFDYKPRFAFLLCCLGSSCLVCLYMVTRETSGPNGSQPDMDGRCRGEPGEGTWIPISFSLALVSCVPVRWMVRKSAPLCWAKVNGSPRCTRLSRKSEWQLSNILGEQSSFVLQSLLQHSWFYINSCL